MVTRTQTLGVNKPLGGVMKSGAFGWLPLAPVISYQEVSTQLGHVYIYSYSFLPDLPELFTDPSKSPCADTDRNCITKNFKLSRRIHFFSMNL